MYLPLRLLRKCLGRRRRLHVVAWGPAQLSVMERLISLAVHYEVDALWVSGHRFCSLPDGDRRALLRLAGRLGLSAIGFVDGHPSWPDRPERVASFYDRLLGDLARWASPALRFAFAVDVEGHARRPWDGELGPYCRLLDDVVIPRVGAFVHAHGGSATLLRFEPWWYRNRPAAAGRIGMVGLRALPCTRIAAMAYRDSAAAIESAIRAVRDRAASEGASYLAGVDVVRDRAVHDLTEALTPILQTDRGSMGGAFVHFHSPAHAARVLSGQGPIGPPF